VSLHPDEVAGLPEHVCRARRVHAEGEPSQVGHVGRRGESLPAVPGGPHHGGVDVLDAEVGRPHTHASLNALPQPGDGITTEGAHGIPARLGAELGAALAAAARANLWDAVNVLPEDGDPFFAELQEVYDDIGEGLPADATRPRPSELPDDHEEIERTGLFEDVVVRHFDWEVSYDADAYLLQLDTFSGHIAMQSWQRDRLCREIRRRLAHRPDGRLRRHWGAVLQVARRAPASQVS